MPINITVLTTVATVTEAQANVITPHIETQIVWAVSHPLALRPRRRTGPNSGQELIWAHTLIYHWQIS